MEMLERLSATKEERELYEERMKWLRDVESAMESREESSVEPDPRAGIKISGITKGWKTLTTGESFPSL
jgi:hypothetical protein